MKSTAILILLSVFAHGQGPLTPPGAPSPEMKSLQEIWDKIGGLESQVATLQTQNSQLENLVTFLTASTVNLPWLLEKVDTAGFVGSHTSLAFGPDGQPAISYPEFGSNSLKFARFNGTTWMTQTVDSLGTVGPTTSLAFGVDGQPAISYLDGGNNDLKFARFNGSAWVATTVDSAGPVGYQSSLAFGPDGQPAISYFDANSDDLKFARKGFFQPAP